MATGPLDGIRILEFTQIIAGPLGCMLLADMGAEVIKVEPPGGEPWRLQNPFAPGESKAFQSFNRGKQSIALKLDTPHGQEVAHRLARESDLVVCNYRPDVAQRLRIDYPTLSAMRPDLVYVDSTAFGRRGPWAGKPGYDIIAQAASGLTANAGRFDERGVPVLSGAGATADFATGYAIAWGACAALFHRERTGEGQLVETSLLVNALMFQSTTFMALPHADDQLREPVLRSLEEGRKAGESYPDLVERRQRYVRGRQVGNIYYRNYLTADGAIAVGNLSRSLRRKMRAALGIDHDPRDDDPAYDPRQPGYIEFGEALTARVETLIRAQPTDHWVALLERHGVPVSPLYFTEELDRHPHVVENEYVVELQHDTSGPQRMAAPPLRMSATPPRAEHAAPPLGRDTDSILSAVGYAEAEIASLREREIVS